MEWNARVLEDLVQRAAERCVPRTLRPKRGRAGEETSPPTRFFSRHPGCCGRTRAGALGKLLGEMNISTAKKQVL